MRTDGRTNSLIPFYSKRALLWRFNVAGNRNTNLRLHVECLILTKFGVSRKIFIKGPHVKFQGNVSSLSRTETDVMKVTGSNKQEKKVSGY